MWRWAHRRQWSLRSSKGLFVLLMDGYKVSSGEGGWSRVTLWSIDAFAHGFEVSGVTVYVLRYLEEKVQCSKRACTYLQQETLSKLKSIRASDGKCF